MASKGSQTPSQTLNCLVSAFYGWQKIFKKLPKNLKNLRIPLSGAPKQGRKAPKALANKDKPRKPRASGQQNDTRRAPPDGGALCAYRERISGTEKEGHSPTEHSVPNTQQRRTPPYLYVSRRLNQLCIRSALQHPGSSCHGEPSQNDRAADHP